MASQPNNLFEGMRAGDLSNLVLPLISVDEYESKVSDKAIVVGFYVQDKDAANDLNRFIQKSPISVLDTEVSPAPDQHGYYLVFVEFLKNDRLGENLKTVLEEMEPLVEIDEWQMRVRKTDGLIDFSEKALTQALARAERTNEDILNFLTPTILENVEIKNDHLTLSGAGKKMEFNILGIDETSALLAKHQLLGSAISLDWSSLTQCQRISGMLGSGWTVSKLDECLLVQAENSPYSLILTARK